MTWLEAIILAIVEGLTEFLPISSTGHLIIAEKLLGLNSKDEFVKLFTVAVQPGAILAVILLYFKRFFQSIDFYIKLLCAFIPTAILGLLLDDWLDSLLGSLTVVATSTLIGGIILLFVDRWFAKAEGKTNPTYQNAAFIGLFQSIAMIPGVSRSAASIIGGMQQGLTRKAAAEFSFLLGVPTLFAASAKKLWDNKDLIKADDMQLLAIGNLVGFFVAILAIKLFINILTKYGFKLFGWYRIVLGTVLLVLIAVGYIA